MDHYTRKPSQTFISVGSPVTFHTVFFLWGFFACIARLTLKPADLRNSVRIICVESFITQTLLARSQESSTWY